MTVTVTVATELGLATAVAVMVVVPMALPVTVMVERPDVLAGSVTMELSSTEKSQVRLESVVVTVARMVALCPTSMVMAVWLSLTVASG